MYRAGLSTAGGAGGALPAGTFVSQELLWTGLLWRPIVEEFDVIAFGAVGDGVVNDGPAINSALAEANVRGGVVTIPPGRYRVTEQLDISGFSDISIIAKRGAVIEFAVADIGLGGTAVTDVTIDGLTIEGSCSRCIALLAGSTRVYVRNCDISAADVIGLGYSAGIDATSADNIWIEGNYLHGNGLGAATQGYDILCNGAGVLHNGIHVRNNWIENSTSQFSIAIFDCGESDALGNSINQGNIGVAAGGTGYGIMFYKTAAIATMAHNQASNNYVRNTAGIGIYMQNSVDSIVSDNVLYDVCKTQTEGSLPLGGISANGDRNCITGNLIDTSAQAGINMTGDRGDITGNLIRNAATNGIYLQGAIDSANVVGNNVSGGVNGIIIGVAAAGEGQTISGNSCQSGTGTGTGIGVAAPGVNFASISNNYCREYQTNIFMAAGAQCSVVGNVCRAATQDNYDIRCTNSLIASNVAQGAIGRGIFCSGAQVNVLNNECVANGGLAVDITGLNSWGEKNRVSAAGPMRGFANLVAGTIVVPTAEITGLANETVRLTRTVPGGIMGFLSLGAIVAGVNFTINSSVVTDVSVVFWEIIH